MNTEERRQEYEFIREEQAKLRRQMARLDQRIEALLAPEAVGLEMPAPPMIPSAPALVAAVTAAPPVVSEVPPPLPIIPPLPPVPPAPVETLPPRIEVPPIPPGEKESWEVQIGTTWLVRIGVVFVLAAFAFLGSYLYQHVVPHLGAGTKVALLYLGAGLLTGAGAWLERRNEKEGDDGKPLAGGMRQYARVVLAGGLAAVYYVTYAAHWNPRLMVVENSILAGGLLLAWTAFMVFLADRRKSETLATFAILLAYYTSAINEIVGFTLFSNLALTVAAIVLLRRHLWKIFPFASLLATYGSYGFWRYFHTYLAWTGQQIAPHSVVGLGGFWMEGTFLAIYWLLFTWVTFAPGEKSLAAKSEAAFAGVNNGAFFALSTWALLADYPGSFWKWSLGFGLVLLALGETGRRSPRRLDARTEGTYQTEGLLLVTWGLISYFSGWHLSLTLAVESTALLLSAGNRESRLLLAASAVVAFLSLAWSLDGLASGAPLSPWITTAAEGAFLVFNAWWTQRTREHPDASAPDLATRDKFRAALVMAPAYFSLLGCAVWFWLIERHVTNQPMLAPALVLAAVALTAAVHGLRIGALAIYAQCYLLGGLILWVGDHSFLAQPGAQTIWNPLILVGGMLAIGHWWQQKRWPGFASIHYALVSAADAVFIVIVLAVWLQPDGLRGRDIWVAESAALSLLLFGYGVYTRYGCLAAAGQYFQFASVAAFCALWGHDWDGRASEALLALGPIGSGVTVLAAARWSAFTSSLPVRLQKASSLFYEAVVMALIVAWGSHYFPHLEKFFLFCLVGGTIFVLGVWRKETRWLLWSGVPIFAGLVIYWLYYSGQEEAVPVHWLGIALLAGQQQFGRRRLPAEMFPVVAQRTLMILATLAAWTWVSERVRGMGTEGTFTLAAGWSLFAILIFAAGFVWRESTYRWLGLAILACTLGRIVLYDIWQLDSLGRILSSFVLGLVLLGIAFVYIKFQKQLRNWF